MPVQVAYPIEEVINEIKSWDFGRQRRVSFEYILFEGLNDTPVHVKELARILDGLNAVLISFVSSGSRHTTKKSRRKSHFKL
jgi:adenine C2-methylase RlmN of 23S rRNA A2503 and tRNA A37